METVALTAGGEFLMPVRGVGAVAEAARAAEGIGWAASGERVIVTELTTGARAGEADAAVAASGSGSMGVQSTSASIKFGNDANQISHAFRHIEASGLDRTKVGDTIFKDLGPLTDTLPAGLTIRKVTVDGIEITYNAFKLPDGTVNIGRITTPH